MAKKYIEVSNFKFDLSGLAYIGTWNIYKTAEYFMRQIQELPAAPVVEVVRCKDCRTGKLTATGKYIRCRSTGCDMCFDDYCSYGAKKDA